MKKKTIQRIILCTGSLFFAFLAKSQEQPILAPWEKGAWETNKYRNLFAEAGYPEDSINLKLEAAYKGVFEGVHKVYFEQGDSMAYVSDLKNNDVRTEGMSYGLMVAVQFDKKDVFDRLWRWAKRYMQYQGGSKDAYFAWSCKVTGEHNAEGSASDGELYFVTSLLFASNRWGDNTGINYHAEARHILDVMMSKTGKEGVTNLINKEHKLITFVPDTGGYQFTDPSYQVPAFYEVWAKWANDGRADFWKACAAESRKFLHKATNSTTGLTSDYSEYDGTPKATSFHPGAQFRFDSWRVPMNIALDYSWSAADKEFQTKYANRIQRFLYQQGINDFVDQYNVDGTPVSFVLPVGGYQTLRHSLGFVATSAAVSLAANNNITRQFVDALWNAKHEPYADGYFDAYYDGFLYLFSLMHLSGRYQIIL